MIDIFEVMNMGILLVLIMLFICGIIIPPSIKREIEERERIKENLNHVAQNLQELKGALGRVYDESVPWDPDYYDIGMIEPRFVKGELKWFRTIDIEPVKGLPIKSEIR